MIKKITSLFLIICILVPSFVLASEGGDFTSLLLERGIISGDERGLRENDSLLRCEFVKMVNRTFNISPSPYENQFGDVKEDDWFCRELSAAYKHGYIKGDEKGNMNPFDPITRQEAVTIIGRLTGSYKSGETHFNDNSYIAPWAKGAVLALSEAEILKGNGDNTFNPSGYLTRYESFVILTRILTVPDTEEIEINSPFKLYLVNIYPNADFSLTESLDLSGKSLPLPLCKDGFNGTFNAKGFKISGLFTEYNDFALFDTISKNGKIENLILVCPEYFASFTKTNNGTIENCGHTSFNKDAKQYQSTDISGAFAWTNNSIIRSCYISSFLKVRNDRKVGGICGINNGTVSDCFSTSDGAENTFGLTVINNGILNNSFCTGSLVACLENKGTVSYVSFMSGESEIGTKTDIDTINDTYFDYPFTKDENYPFPVLKNVTYSEGDNLGEFGGGSGSKDDPYIVATSKHLKNAAKYPNACFLQKNDIDMWDIYDFTPIGTSIEPFSGEYNGNGYVIKNLSITDPKITEPALFGVNTGKIYNLHLENGYIKSPLAAASVIYRNYGICSFVTSSALVEAENAGGIICYAENSSYVEKSTFSGRIEATNGGGVIHTNNAIVKNCVFAGIINSINAGGICYANRNLVENTFSMGIINSSRKDDIILSNSADTLNCYYTYTSYVENASQREEKQYVFKESFPGFDFSQIWEIDFAPLPKGTNKYLITEKENTVDFAGGNGSIAKPYKIATPVNFMNIKKYPSASFILMNDLDFGVIGTKTPLDAFSGTLDGNGHKISGLDKNEAIIFENNGTVKNLFAYSKIAETNNAVILNCHISAAVSCDKAGGICTDNNGLIGQCSFDGEIFASVTGGGICTVNKGLIENCLVSGAVTGKNQNSAIHGIAENDDGIINLCISVADLFFTDETGKAFPVSNNYTNSKYLDRYNEKYDGKLTFSEIVKKNTYTGFDFNNVWGFNEFNLPVLKGNSHSDYNISTPFKSGDGSKEKPYTVSNSSDLHNIRMYPYAHFVLTNDIDLAVETENPSILNNACKGFTPIYEFYGSIDGKGYNISGLEILHSDYASACLIQKLYGIVKNIKFLNCRIEGRDNSGIVCSENYGQIDTVTVTGSRIGVKNGSCGSIAGVNKDSISNCQNQSDIFSQYATGGIAGINEKDIVSCTNYGGIITNSSDSNAHSGGIAGINNGFIKTSVNNGRIISYSDLSESASGGITGQNKGDIANCYNTGQISSKGTVKSISGGIAGVSEESSYITNVYNIAYCTSESPTPLTGALIGYAKGRIFNAYYDNTLTFAFGENNLSKDTSKALSPDRMADIYCYENFNTKNIWTYESSYAYPQLIENPHRVYPLTENIRDFAGGDGSMENPYLIFTPQQLDNVRKYLGAVYMLIGDLDMSKYCELNGFEPIGDNVFSFFGTFIGNSNSIIGIKQSGAEFGGLFSRNDGEIYNLITENFEINAQTSGNIAAINTGLIYKCINTSNIQATGKTVMAGGVAGLNKASGMIIYSSNTGDISTNGDNSQTGGICYGNYGIIAGSFNSGNYVFSEGSKLSMAGGITSFNYGTVSDCYSNADIYSTDISGGICATNSGNLINCYTTATKVFGKTAGGICANAQNSFIGNCYYPIDRIETGVAFGNYEGAIGVISTTMLSQSTFVGFDFENMWIMIDGYCPLISEALTE